MPKANPLSPRKLTKAAVEALLKAIELAKERGDADTLERAASGLLRIVAMGERKRLKVKAKQPPTVTRPAVVIEHESG